MKKIVIFSTIIFLSITYSFATEQFPDLLIIENDTFYLKSFPLEELRLKEKFKESPFDYYENIDFPHTGCYRGYVATWKVIDNKLILIKIEKVDSTHQELNIEDYLKKNDYKASLVNNQIFADWYSDTLKQYDYFMYYFNSKRYYLAKVFLENPEKKNELIFNQGVLIENNITRIDSYLVGDTLTKEISYYRQWFLKRGLANVVAIITENNGSMVRVEFVDFGTKKKSAIKEIKHMIGIREEKEHWINPRYWKKTKITPCNRVDCPADNQPTGRELNCL
ncbi:MAG: hypothetical protein BGP01_03160 [Paludibacter sp. 47-17]|jgi:hypothetical protein|nr:MAG: hypothetical protein BGP01_03160 [Paludibacter sp. 47-17]